ncbi:MAG: hypothetical protein LBR68_06170, partial [Lachnoclostridium sp.]|nr:hypothetical protein [Lachnoclostridium sp.]
MSKKIFGVSKKVFAFAIIFTMLIGSVCSYTTTEAAKKPSLYIKTVKYTSTNQTKNSKKKQTIRIKNFTSKMKVKWKSGNKKLATVKAGKKGKAKLTVSLKKAGTARITATIRNKRTNKKISVLSKKITVIAKTVVPTIKPPVSTPTPKVQVTSTPTAASE